MRFRDALADHRRVSEQDRVFPGERRTTRGLFTGSDERLVHVSPDGTLRDFGYPLSGTSGLARARFGVVWDGDVRWFTDGEQRYEPGTTRVETTHTERDTRLTQTDATAGETHYTTVRWRDAPLDAALVVRATFAPDGREDRVGQLHHDGVVEVFHTTEHDFLAGGAGFRGAEGRVERLGDALTGGSPDAPTGRYEERSLSGVVQVAVPFTDGVATVATRVTTDPDRESVVAALRRAVRGDDHPAAGGSVPGTAADQSPSVAADLRVLELLSARSGLRMAGPEFDPFHTNSGGYGYTWFRDDAEIARCVLTADRRLGLDVADWHARTARRYVVTQLSDGTWPHRVWPSDGSLAPGWAHGRLEAGDDVAYQADQTASVVAFLAAYAPDAPSALRGEIAETLTAAVEGLDSSLAADGRPVVCQNAWENMDGRFTHTAATFLRAYAAVADCVAVPDATRQHSREQARTVHDAMSDLWMAEEGRYALRERIDGTVDPRLDSATFALVAAHRVYDRAVGTDTTRVERLGRHVEATVTGLTRETPALRGLIRFEGDDWRRGGQSDPKVWTVATGWGANACLGVARLRETHGGDAAAAGDRARDLLGLLRPDGPLSVAGHYL
ncbi:MAG: glucan 1,4-alpha-glucosidase, partial [Halobaculum sp.]